MRNRVLLLSLARSGSTMLCEMLDSHPHVVCRHEWTNDWRRARMFDGSMDALARSSGKPVVVVHAQFDQIYPAMLRPGLPRILLERDYINGALSEMRSLHGNPAGATFALPNAQFAKRVAERNARTTMMRAFADLSVSYEALTGNEDVVAMPEVVGQQLCAFLGVPYYEMRPRRRKNKAWQPANMEELEHAVLR